MTREWVIAGIEVPADRPVAHASTSPLRPKTIDRYGPRIKDPGEGDAHMPAPVAGLPEVSGALVALRAMTGVTVAVHVLATFDVRHASCSWTGPSTRHSTWL